MSLRERPQIQKVLSSPMTEAFAQLRAQRKVEKRLPVRAACRKAEASQAEAETGSWLTATSDRFGAYPSERVSRAERPLWVHLRSLDGHGRRSGAVK
jgi:hypothetical protein